MKKRFLFLCLCFKLSFAVNSAAFFQTVESLPIDQAAVQVDELNHMLDEDLKILEARLQSQYADLQKKKNEILAKLSQCTDGDCAMLYREELKKNSQALASFPQYRTEKERGLYEKYFVLSRPIFIKAAAYELNQFILNHVDLQILQNPVQQNSKIDLANVKFYSENIRLQYVFLYKNQRHEKDFIIGASHELFPSFDLDQRAYNKLNWDRFLKLFLSKENLLQSCFTNSGAQLSLDFLIGNIQACQDLQEHEASGQLKKLNLGNLTKIGFIHLL